MTIVDQLDGSVMNEKSSDKTHWIFRNGRETKTQISWWTQSIIQQQRLSQELVETKIWAKRKVNIGVEDRKNKNKWILAD